jgi:putative lipoic acid-binding regulatory protein
MEDPYLNLRKQLELEEWPNVYMFKFIFPNTLENIALTSELFSETSELSLHESKTGKFASISVKEMMLDVDSIITIYEKASLIKGLMAL